MNENLFGFIFVLIGLFPIAAVLFNWQFFMNNYRARLVAKVLGQTGMRVFYILLGLGFVVFGFLNVIGVVKLAS